MADLFWIVIFMLPDFDRFLYYLSREFADADYCRNILNGNDDKSNDGILSDDLGIITSDRVDYDICDVMLLCNIDKFCRL